MMMMMHPLLRFHYCHLLVWLSSMLGAVQNAEWNYGEHGPDMWSETYPLCAGRSQSPINILSSCTTSQKFAPFQFTRAYNVDLTYSVENNGHTLVAIYEDELNPNLTLIGGNLTNPSHQPYMFRNVHLHWGENRKSGSEHQVNGVKYAGEIHFVHITEDQHIAVLAFLMQSEENYDTNSTEQGRAWKAYFDAVSSLKYESNETTVTMNLATLMGGNLNSLTDFWRYTGSLTTPPCTEGIIWTVFRNPILFSEDELKLFRQNVYFEDYRGPQPLLGRTVYSSFGKTSIGSTDPCCGSGTTGVFKFSNGTLLSSWFYMFFLFFTIF